MLKDFFVFNEVCPLLLFPDIDWCNGLTNRENSRKQEKSCKLS